jgi:hypothetical protein
LCDNFTASSENSETLSTLRTFEDVLLDLEEFFEEDDALHFRGKGTGKGCIVCGFDRRASTLSILERAFSLGVLLLAA